MMTKKDYELIAAVFAKFTGEAGDVVERDAMAYDLADALAADNPRFSREIFLVAAGVWSKCEKCRKRATLFTGSGGSYCDVKHAPAWVRKARAAA
jgi:hypothetical protein